MDGGRAEGDQRPLPPSVELSAYRIVQEALTNSLRHVGPGHAELVVRYLPEAVEVDVRDDGGHCTDEDGGGYGLVGFDGVIDVVIADDESLVRGGIRMILEVQPDLRVVGEAADGAAAVRLVEQRRPDVVLMDVRMPVLDGLAAARRLLEHRTESRVLMLTTFGLDEYLCAALRTGGSGFLLKSVPPEELVHALRATVAGDALLSPTITRRPFELFVRRPRSGGGVPEQLAGLTEREVEVLRLVARGRSNAEIASDLYRRRDRQDPRQPDLPQVRTARPGTGRGRRLRDRARPARRCRHGVTSYSAATRCSWRRPTDGDQIVQSSTCR